MPGGKVWMLQKGVELASVPPQTPKPNGERKASGKGERNC